MMSVRSTLLLLSCAAMLSGSSAAPSDTKLRQLLQRSLLAPMQGQEVQTYNIVLHLYMYMSLRVQMALPRPGMGDWC